MQDLPDFVPAFSHHLKPLLRDGSQFTFMLFHPRIDGGIAFDSSVESQQLLSHRRSIFAFGSMLRGTLREERKGEVLRNAHLGSNAVIREAIRVWAFENQNIAIHRTSQQKL